MTRINVNENAKVTTMEIMNHGDSSKMPQLKLMVTSDLGEDGTATRSYYLSPFRGYRFQVSGNADGECDYGSSEVIGLGNVVAACDGYKAPSSNSSIYAANDSMCQIIFRGLIKCALDQAKQRCGFSIPMQMEDDGWRDDIIDEFVDDSINYIKARMR